MEDKTIYENGNSPEDPAFSRWHGMSSIITDIELKVNLKKDVDAPVNGWVMLAVILGVNVVADRLATNLNTIALVSALLISSSLSMVYSPSTSFTGISSFTQELIGFFVSITLAIGCHFSCIIMSCLSSQAMNTCARDADRWRMLLSFDAIPTTIYTLFTVGNMCLLLSIMFSMVSLYGDLAYIFAGILLLFCGLFMNIFNSKFLLSKTHVVHGWYKNNYHEYDIEIPLKKVQALAALDIKNRERSRDNKLPFVGLPFWFFKIALHFLPMLYISIFYKFWWYKECRIFFLF